MESTEHKRTWTPTIGLIHVFAISEVFGALGVADMVANVWGAVISGVIYILLVGTVWGLWKVQRAFDKSLAVFSVGYLILSYIFVLDVVGIWNVFSLNSENILEAEMYLFFLGVGVIFGVFVMQTESMSGESNKT